MAYQVFRSQNPNHAILHFQSKLPIDFDLAKSLPPSTLVTRLVLNQQKICPSCIERFELEKLHRSCSEAIASIPQSRCQCACPRFHTSKARWGLPKLAVPGCEWRPQRSACTAAHPRTRSVGKSETFESVVIQPVPDAANGLNGKLFTLWHFVVG